MQPLAMGLREAARLVGVSPFTLRRQIRNGTIRSVRIGKRRLLIPFSELERLVSTGKSAPASMQKDEVLEGNIS